MKEPCEGWKSVAAASWRDDAKDFARKSVFPQKKQDRGPNFSFWQVNYGKLLEIDFFSLCHNIWGVAKLQDLGNKKSQTVGVALRRVSSHKDTLLSAELN